MDIKKQVFIAAALAAVWFIFRKSKAGKIVDRVIYSYNGTLMSPEQASMIAEQDAAFSNSPDAFLTGPFHYDA